MTLRIKKKIEKLYVKDISVLKLILENTYFDENPDQYHSLAGQLYVISKLVTLKEVTKFELRVIIDHNLYDIISEYYNWDELQYES